MMALLQNMLAQTRHPSLGKQAGVVKVTILSESSSSYTTTHIYKIVMCLLQQTFIHASSQYRCGGCFSIQLAVNHAKRLSLRDCNFEKTVH